MKSIKLGIWGCGGHGYYGHGKVLDEVVGLDLVALCDISSSVSEDIRSKTGNNANIACFTNPKEMLKIVDAVIIATPDRFHIEHLRMAVGAGKHVFIEKPIFSMSSEMTEIVDLLDIAEDNGLVVTSCHLRRFDPPFIWFKQNFSQLISEMGPAVSFHYDFVYHKPSAIWKASRSLLLDHHGHEIDLVNFLFGMCSFDEILHDDSYDRYLVTGSRSDGIKFSFHGTRRMEESVFLEWMTVDFAGGRVVVDTHSGLATIQDKVKNTVRECSCGPTDYRKRSIGVTQNFADAIFGEAENYLTRADLIVNNMSGVMLLEEGRFSM